MSPSSPVRAPHQALRRRLRFLQVGLLLPVLITAALGVAYVSALRARQQAVDAAGRQLARRLADDILTAAGQIGTAAAQSILAPARQLPSPTLQRLVAVVARAQDSLRACRCGPLKDGEFIFAWVPATGEFHSSAPIPAGRDPRRRLAGWSTDTAAGPTEIWGPGGLDTAGTWLVHLTQVPLDPSRVAVVGFDVSMDSWWRGTFQPAIHEVAARAFPMLADPDTAFAAALRVEGVPLAGNDSAYTGPWISTPLLTGSGFRLGVRLNPSTLSLFLAPAGPAAYPLLVGALGASILISVLAMILLRQVQRTVAEREAFVASISHELRTPLTELLLHADSLYLNRQTPESNQRAAGTIVRETRRLIGLAENALAVAGVDRPETGPVAPVALAPIVAETLQLLGPALATRQVRVASRLDEEAWAAINPVALDRIITNLVDNALRYGPAGQTIGVSCIRRGDRVEIAVEDEGPGVSRRERRRIFAIFTRGSAARQSPASTGLGLGLAIVRHLVDSAGGSIAVAAAASGGARFVVTLPVAVR